MSGGIDHVVSAWLFAVDDEAFRDIVAQDARGSLDSEATAALRHPLALRRWLTMLTLLAGEAKTQLAEKKPNGRSIEVATRQDPEFAEWHRRFCRWRQSLLERKAEAEHLIAEQVRSHGRQWQRAAEDKARSAELTARQTEAAQAAATGENGTSRKVRKRMTGDLALERLIELHRDDFARLMDEASAELDVPAEVLARVARLVRAGLTLRAAEAFVRTSWPAGEIAAGVRIEVAD